MMASRQSQLIPTRTFIFDEWLMNVIQLYLYISYQVWQANTGSMLAICHKQ